jgi:hypothetical protein
MKAKSTLVACAAAAALLLALPTRAAEPEKPTQQSRFAACAHESKGLKGEEHQKFMSECLKGHDPEHAKDVHRASAEGGQQNRMKECNEEAGRKNLHGDERRSFMSACLKG